MDTDDILEKHLNSRFSTSQEIISTAAPSTFLANPLGSSALGESKDTVSNEKEGVSQERETVLRFLKLFNSSSQSFLEASQCDALVYALKNKLAVIQGEYSILL